MDLFNLSIHEANDCIKKGEITSQQLVQSYIDRLNDVEKDVNSALKIMGDDVIDHAKEIDEKKLSGEGIAGIPYGLKDNICTENIETTCASKMLYNFIPPYNATVVEKLNDNNAIMIAKMNMDEFAMGSSTENSRFKITSNPWNLGKVPGGSSGGSAAAVAAGQVAFALGSDTGGSIREPASFCGVVGLKPTYGLISRYGLIAFASSLDQIGPLTKDVQDCAIVLNALAGHDEKDSTSVQTKSKDYTSFLNEDIKGMKIGIPREYFSQGLNGDVEKSVKDAIALFEDMGAQIIDTSLPYSEYALSAYYIISSAEASSNLARYDGIRYGYSAKEFDNLIDLYRKTRSEGFGDEVKRRIMLGTYALSSGYYDAYYKKALQVRTLIKEDFDRVFKTCDILLSPTCPSTAFSIGEKSDDPMEMYLSDIYTVPVNISGIPAMSIPCGFDSENLPIGLQLLGRPFEEEVLLKAGYAFQKQTDFHVKRPALGGK